VSAAGFFIFYDPSNHASRYFTFRSARHPKLGSHATLVKKCVLKQDKRVFLLHLLYVDLINHLKERRAWHDFFIIDCGTTPGPY
jgi:hypothetical protein